MNYANGILHDRAGAEDVVQEAYLRFSAAADSGQIVNPVSYLYRIVRNLALDWTRRRSVEPPKMAAPRATDRRDRRLRRTAQFHAFPLPIPYTASAPCERCSP